jgi:hypothetical protein
MKFDNPVNVIEGDHKLLDLTRDQVAAILYGAITQNAWIVRDAAPNAHCQQHAMQSMQQWIEQRMYQEPPFDYINDESEQGQTDLEFVRAAVATRMGIPYNVPTSTQKSWDIYKMIAFMAVCIPSQYEGPWLSALDYFIDGRADKLRTGFNNSTSYQLRLDIAEEGRQVFNRLHADDPIPGKEYPANAELEQRIHASGLLASSDYPTKLN